MTKRIILIWTMGILFATGITFMGSEWEVFPWGQVIGFLELILLAVLAKRFNRIVK